MKHYLESYSCTTIMTGQSYIVKSFNYLYAKANQYDS